MKKPKKVQGVALAVVVLTACQFYQPENESAPSKEKIVAAPTRQNLTRNGVLVGQDNCPDTPNPFILTTWPGNDVAVPCDNDIPLGPLVGPEGNQVNAFVLCNLDVGEWSVQPDAEWDGIGDSCDDDDDNDGIGDNLDDCQFVADDIQSNADLDGLGDACDPDADNDDVDNGDDVCPLVADPDQTDTDGDGVGDACQDDNDGDGVLDDVDNCPLVANPEQTDLDEDGLGAACDVDDDGDQVNDQDNCPDVANADQADTDGDGLGDACDQDADNDTILNPVDNCPLTANREQTDTDGNGVGDACTDDRDGDGVVDDGDNCVFFPNTDQADDDGDGDGNRCDVDCDGDGGWEVDIDEVNIQCDNAEDFDLDGDGWTQAEGDCLDGNPDVNPGRAEICGLNHVDEDCSGHFNDGCDEPPPPPPPPPQCDANNLCPVGQQCNVGVCEPIPGFCDANNPCGGNQVCNANSRCEDPPPPPAVCQQHADCGNGMLCIANTCVAAAPNGQCSPFAVEVDADPMGPGANVMAYLQWWIEGPAHRNGRQPDGLLWSQDGECSVGVWDATCVAVYTRFGRFPCHPLQDSPDVIGGVHNQNR